MPVNQSEAPWPALRRASRTVVVVDVVESVRLMEQDEDDTIRRWQSFVGEVVTRLLPQHGGRLVKSLGDGLMLEFESVLPAVQCALAMQQAIQPYNHGRASEQWMCLRIGVHVADVVVDHLDIYGSGVNLAARLATLAGPGEVVVSPEARDGLTDGLDVEVEDLGLRYVKHVQEPIRVFRVAPEGCEAVRSLPALPSSDFRSSVAVIPLRPRQPGSDTDVLGEVVADELIAALSRAGELRVVSRLSTSRVSHVAGEPETLRAKLGVVFALTGSYHIVGDRMRMSLELCDTESCSVVWADNLTASVRGVLEGTDEAVPVAVARVGQAIIARELERASTQPLQTLQVRACPGLARSSGRTAWPSGPTPCLVGQMACDAGRARLVRRHGPRGRARVGPCRTCIGSLTRQLASSGDAWPCARVHAT